MVYFLFVFVSFFLCFCFVSVDRYCGGCFFVVFVLSLVLVCCCFVFVFFLLFVVVVIVVVFWYMCE